MKFVKYFLLLMTSAGYVSGAEQQSIAPNTSFSVLSMTNRTHHTHAPQAFFNDLVASCEVSAGQKIWATCSQSSMQGELWTVGSDNTVIPLGSITPPQDFGLSGSIENIKLHKIMGQIYFVAHDKQGVLVYALNSEARTLLDQSARALSKFAGVVGASVSSVLSAARETAQSSPVLPHPVAHSSVCAGHRIVLPQAPSGQDPLEDRRWFLTPISGGSVFIQNEIRDIVCVEERDNSGILILRKLGSSVAGEDFSSLLHYVGMSKDRCLASPCSPKWDRALTKAGFTLLQNISAMKSNGNNGIIFGGTGKVGGSCFVGMSNNVKSPQTLFTIDIAEGGIPQQLPMYLATAAIALLHQKNIPHVNMLKALQSLLADKRKTLVEVTSNYAIMTSGSFLEQVSYDENNWSTGRFILLYAGKRPNIFSDGSVLQKEERDKSSFYFFPTKFILAESDSIAGGLSEVRPGAGMVSADLSSALAPSESDPEEEQEELILSSHGRVAVLPTDDKSLEEGNAADDMDPLEASIVSTALVASEGEDKEGVLLGDSSGSLLADSPALMQSILGVSSGAPESGMTVSDEVQQQISTLVDTFVVQDDEEPAQDLSAKDDDGKKKKKKKKAARDTKA